MPTPTAKVPGYRQLNSRISDEHAIMLQQIADNLCQGSKSEAVALLLNMYGGKILERALQEKETEQILLVQTFEKWEPPKLSPELVAYVAGLVRAGNMPEVAFAMAGIPKRLYVQWNKKGRNDRSVGKQSLHADWAAAIERSEAECEAEDIARLRAHGRTSWNALAWRLERQYPDRYAQRKRMDAHVQHSVFPVVDWDRLDPHETRTLVELLRKASPELDDPSLSRMARPAAELVPADVIEGEATEAPALESARTEAPTLEEEEADWTALAVGEALEEAKREDEPEWTVRSADGDEGAIVDVQDAPATGAAEKPDA